MSDNSFAEKFPDLQPGVKPSGLGSVNGFGTSMHGRRDYDADTGTYVITHCLTALFIPLIAIGSYRVANAENGGWYVLGRVPLSRLARRWNLFLLLAVLVGIGSVVWHFHTTSPDYVAGRKLDEADEAAAAGQGGKAARICREVMDTKTAKAEVATRKLAGYIENPPGEAPAVYVVAVDLHRLHRCPVEDPFGKGKSLAVRYAADDPVLALNLLDVIAPLAPDPKEELDLRQDLLEKLFAKSPNDAAIASRLAAVYEAKGERAKCETLLVPFEASLGTFEGAAILGRIYAGKGELDKANALLAPFVAKRLPALRDAEQQMNGAFQRAQERTVNMLKSGNAPGFDFKLHEHSAKAKQNEMVDDYIGEQLQSDPALLAARKSLIEQRSVVGAVLDLGVVQLQRGQAMSNPAARQAELEKAEKTFLSVRGFAGETESYRLSLGQVYYWLGRAPDGKKLFDELQASQKNSTDISVQIAHILREVGEVSDSRRMVEDAYKRESNLEKKRAIAAFRSVLTDEFDEKIVWLMRADTNSLNIQAELATTRGQQAQRDGKDEEAVGHFHRALDVYAKMPDSTATFNNSALVLFALFDITRNREDLTRGLDKLDRAIALKPSDSILLYNGATTAMDGAIRDAIGNDIDLRAIKGRAGWDAIAYLYRTPAERTAIVTRIMNHPSAVKARAYAEKLVVLAPKRGESYQILSSIFDNARDLAGLKDVATRAEKADVDTQDNRREFMDFISGKSDVKKREESRAATARAASGLAAARPIGGKTFSLAVGRYVRAKTAGWTLGEPADPDELVKFADDAHTATPSAGTEATLEAALLFRAHLSSIKQDPEYARLAKKTQRSLGTNLIYYTLVSEGPQRHSTAANPDVKRLAALAIEESTRHPDDATSGEWILVRAVHPEKAKEVGERAKGNAKRKVHQQLSRALAPYHASTILGDYWEFILDGNGVAAKKVLAEMQAKGIPAP